MVFYFVQDGEEPERKNQMASKNSLHLNSSNSSGIPDHIYSAIMDMEPECSGSWGVSLIPDQVNDIWELKLTPEQGIPRRHNLETGSQNAQGVQRALRELMDFAVQSTAMLLKTT